VSRGPARHRAACRPRLADGVLRAATPLLFALGAATGVLPAQTAPASAPHRPPALVRYGKWAALGLAAGSLYLGAATHHDADRAYSDLLDYCRASGPCPIGLDGRYTNPGAEALYRRVRDRDRAARIWLVGGQVALLTSAALFLVDLQHGGEPPNIPFAPYVAAGRFGTHLGVRWSWR
jgi:hypothetical protein